MILLDSAFGIIGASPRDTRDRLLLLAEDRALRDDASRVAKARADLFNPRRRLWHELRWMPGVAPGRAESLVAEVIAGARREAPDGITPLAAANVVATALSFFTPTGATEEPLVIALTISKLATLVDRVQPERLLLLINEDRMNAGFPTIDDVGEVAAALEGWREDIRIVSTKLFRLLTRDAKIASLTSLVNEATASGQNHGPWLAHAVIDSLESDLLADAGSPQESIDGILDEMMRRAEAGAGEADLSSWLAALERAATDWDTVVQPLQISAMSRGIQHAASEMLAARLRDVSIQLHNRHGHTTVAKRITVLMGEVFAELPEVVEQSTADLETLDDLLAQKRKREADQAEWERSITWEGTTGLVFKERFRISPEGIEKDRVRIPLDEVEHVRWGATRTSLNGIPTGTDCVAWILGARRVVIDMSTRNVDAFASFIGCLQRAVLWRLVNKLARRLGSGEQIRFGQMVVTDGGIILERSRFLAANEARMFGWGDLRLSSADGSFIVSTASDRKFACALSYRDVTDAHVLEGLLRAFFKADYAARPSEAFAYD